MFAAFNALRLAASARGAIPAPEECMAGMLFEVQLVDAATVKPHRIGTEPLTVFTKQPLEVAGELMRDRDPTLWDVRIRALPRNERPV